MNMFPGIVIGSELVYRRRRVLTFSTENASTTHRITLLHSQRSKCHSSKQQHHKHMTQVCSLDMKLVQTQLSSAQAINTGNPSPIPPKAPSTDITPADKVGRHSCSSARQALIAGDIEVRWRRRRAWQPHARKYRVSAKRVTKQRNAHQLIGHTGDLGNREDLGWRRVARVLTTTSSTPQPPLDRLSIAIGTHHHGFSAHFPARPATRSCARPEGAACRTHGSAEVCHSTCKSTTTKLFSATHPHQDP